MEFIKGSKEYIWLRIQDKADKQVDMSEHNIAFSLKDTSAGNLVIDGAAVEKVYYDFEDYTGAAFRYLLDTSTIDSGDYLAIFEITNGDELIIRREPISIVE
jgi:hypothetical protein